MDNSRLADLGKNPIAGDAATGINAKYEDEYEQLKNELAKMEAVSSGSPIDWNLINDLAVDILEKKSKDITICCYLAYGLYKKQGLKGFNQGLQVIKDILETYFDDMFPPRPRARANAMSWLGEKIEPLISGLDPDIKDYADLDACLESLKGVQDVCYEKMADNAPALGALKSAISKWRNYLKTQVDAEAKKAEQLKAQQEKKKQQEQQTEQPQQTNTQTVAQPSTSSAPAATKIKLSEVAAGDIADDKEVKAAIRSVQSVVRKIAAHKRQANH